MKTTVYLSLGSNLGDRHANLLNALERLRSLGTIGAVSDVYESEPVEVTGTQPWYLNCAVAMESELGPQQFLERSLSIERDMGRHRQGDKSPRTIDLDIVFFGNCVIETPGLSVPHPGLARRRFVLQPLAEIAPDFVDPRSKRKVTELLDALPPDSGMLRKYSVP